MEETHSSQLSLRRPNQNCGKIWEATTNQSENMKYRARPKRRKTTKFKTPQPAEEQAMRPVLEGICNEEKVVFHTKA